MGTQSWGLLRRRTKLFFRKCRNFVGVGYEDGTASSAGSDNSDSVSGNGRLRGRNTLSRLGLCSRHLHLTSQVFLSLPDVHGQVDITYAS